MVDFTKIAEKWQKKWEENNIFKVSTNSKKKKFYCLEMFPYSSGYGLHMGHVRNYTIGDSYARYMRMKGFNLLYPMGYDSFGLPAENAAIKNKSHPKIFTEKAIELMRKHQKQIGLSYDWDREIITCNPDYYKWNQWLFLKFFKKGLAYRKKAPINWCPSCNTVLANEQVEHGKCWRCNSEVEIKSLEQWFFRITKYADELLRDIKKLEWPEKIKAMQENWIGRSEGTMIDFQIKGSDKRIQVFTTRPDTLFGVTFMLFAPEHPLVPELVKGTKHEKQVNDFVKKVVIEEKFTRAAEETEKKGVFIGRYAINPANNEEISIYIANFVLLEYGTGAVMAVPAHDQRDFEFAKKYGLPVKLVITPTHYELKAERMSRAFIDDGVLVNSGEFNGTPNRQAIDEITAFLKKKGKGGKSVQYKLRDWLISRQRYWGTPIPIVYCDKCGIVPVPEGELPVLLPANVKFTGRGNPLAAVKAFVDTKCPKCKGKARRETDTMDTFVDSSWYFLRFCSPKNKKAPFDAKEVRYWMPVDQYIGGAEHAVMHLLYARFFTKVLRDEKMLGFDEPFTRLFNQGTVIKDSKKMSKSYGNVVSQDEIAKKYGIDTARFYLLFVASPDKELEWNDEGIEGAFRAVKRFYDLYFEKHQSKNNAKDEAVQAKTNSLVKKIGEDIEGFRQNAALVSMAEFVNYLSRYRESISAKTYTAALKKLAVISSPFIPHTAEECWEKTGGKGFVSLEKWPAYDAKKARAELEQAENYTEQLYSDIRDIIKLVGRQPKQIQIIISDSWKFEAARAISQQTEKTRNQGEIIRAVMQNSELRKHGNEISGMVQRALKTGKLQQALSQANETKAINDERPFMEKEFKCKVDIAREKDSKAEKARQAMPGKPAIVIS